MILKMQPLKVYYMQELIMRIQAYFFDQFLFSVLNTDPYTNPLKEWEELKQRMTMRYDQNIRDLQ